MRKERFQISRTNHTKPRRTSRRNVQSAVPRAKRMIHPTRRLVARGSANKLSEPKHLGREHHHQVRHGRDSKCFTLVITVTQRRKMINWNRMQEQHTRRQSLLAFNQLSRFQKKTSQMDVEPGPTSLEQGQGQGKL